MACTCVHENNRYGTAYSTHIPQSRLMTRHSIEHSRLNTCRLLRHLPFSSVEVLFHLRFKQSSTEALPLPQHCKSRSASIPLENVVFYHYDSLRNSAVARCLSKKLHHTISPQRHKVPEKATYASASCCTSRRSSHHRHHLARSHHICQHIFQRYSCEICFIVVPTSPEEIPILEASYNRYSAEILRYYQSN